MSDPISDSGFSSATITLGGTLHVNITVGGTLHMNSLQPTLNFIKTGLYTINLVGDQLVQPLMCVICANLKLYANQQNHLARQLGGNTDQAYYIVYYMLLVEWCGWMDGWMEVWPGKGWEPRKQWVGQQRRWMDDLGKELPFRIFQILTRTLPPGFTRLYVRDSGLS